MTSDPRWSGFSGQMLRASVAFFASSILQGPLEAPYNGRWVAAEHHQAWDTLVTTKRRLCVLAPRDHGKSWFFSLAYPIWQAAFHPRGRGYIFSATLVQAQRILADIKDEIESNPQLAWLLPSSKKTGGRTTWSSSSITLANGHKIYARGYGSKVRGAHPDWIVVDDGLNDEDGYSPVIRRKHIDYFYTAITNMIVPGGQIVVVGTPFHGEDLYADLSTNPQYTFRSFPALDASTTKPLWALRYSKSSLADKASEIGPVRFTREFLCQPISDNMSLFPERLFKGDPIEQPMVCLGWSRKRWIEEIGIVSFYVGCDFAISSSTGADHTVIFVVGVDGVGNRWVVDIVRKKGLEYQHQLALINAVGRRYQPDLMYLESNQMQRIFGDELIRTTDLPIRKFITTGQGKTSQAKKHPSGNTVSSNKNSLEGGVPRLRVMFENKKWRIPRGDARSVEMTDIWIAEMRNFTWLDGKLQGVGSHDDTVMACWIVDSAIRDSGFGFSTGDESETLDSEAFDKLLKEMSTPDPIVKHELPEVAVGLWEAHGDDEPGDEPRKETAHHQLIDDEQYPTPGAAPTRGMNPLALLRGLGLGVK